MDKTLTRYRFFRTGLSGTKTIFRDPMLILIFAAPILLAAVTYCAIPAGADLLMKYTAFDLSLYYPLITAFFATVPTLMYGMLTGFTILDEKDENILIQISLTPFGLKRHYFVRTGIFSIFAFIFAVFFLRFNPLYSIGIIRTAAISVCLSIEGAAAGLFIAAAAKNKVEGLTMGKALGIFMLAPAIPFFVPPPFHYFAAAVPNYWIGMLVFSSCNSALIVTCSLLVHSAVLFAVWKKALLNIAKG